MTSHYPVVLEHEPNGTVSTYVVGLPGVFAAADSERGAASAIRVALRARLGFVGLGALLGRRRSAKKAAAARVNGRQRGTPSERLSEMNSRE